MSFPCGFMRMEPYHRQRRSVSIIAHSRHVSIFSWEVVILIYDKRGFLLIEALMFLCIASCLVLLVVQLMASKKNLEPRYEGILKNSMIEEIYRNE